MSYNLSVKAKPAYQVLSLLTLLRMGHCAPTVMHTMLQITHNQQQRLVKLAAGMPGGIGNTEAECGGLTSPLIILGLRHGLREMRAGLPVLFDLGHAYCRQFFDKNASLLCKEIQGVRQCMQAVCWAPGLLAETLATDNQNAIPDEQRVAYARLYAHLLEHDFHCAHAVLQHLRSVIPSDQELADAVSAYLGGTLFKGMTCSAFAAGVMAIGLKTGQIENSYLRVIRMLVKGMNIKDESANKFHRTINAGHRLSKWLVAEYGSTQCQAITQCDFSSAAGVEQYIANDGLATCRQIARGVAEKAQEIIKQIEFSSEPG